MDDTAAIASAKTCLEAQNRMPILFDKISDWLALNKLSLNDRYPVFMTFGNYGNSVPLQID